MLNPWLLAAAIFGLIGLLDETKNIDGKKTKALPTPKKPAEKSSQTIVNVHGTEVKSGVKDAKQDKKPKAKPTAKVPAQPSPDG